jgi:hypothetical protein
MRQMRRFQMVALVALVGVSVAGCARVDPGQARANGAWSARLAAQAEAQQQETARMDRARAAWSQSLTAQAVAYQEAKAARERANEAWSEGLNELAEAILGGGMSDAATQAWTDRLNGLAEYHGVVD